MSLASAILNIHNGEPMPKALRLNVYGMGKSSEGVDFITVTCAQLRTLAGQKWHNALISFDGPLGTASFGKPYEIDGIMFVRIYNAPPRKNIEALEREHSKAFAEMCAAEKENTETEARYKAARRDLNEASQNRHEKKAALEKAARALRNAREASGASIAVDIEPRTYRAEGVTFTINGVEIKP